MGLNSPSIAGAGAFAQTSRWANEDLFFALPAETSLVLSTFQWAANTFSAVPFVVRRPCTAIELAIRVRGAAGAGGKIRFGIYNADQSSLKPTSLLYSSAEFAADVASTVRKTGVIAGGVVFQPDTVYYSAVLGSTLGGTVEAVTTGGLRAILPYVLADGAGNDLVAIRSRVDVAQAYGALPANFPNTVASANAFSNLPGPCIFARFV